MQHSWEGAFDRRLKITEPVEVATKYVNTDDFSELAGAEEQGLLKHFTECLSKTVRKSRALDAFESFDCSIPYRF